MMAAELRRLPGPYELLDLPDRGSARLRIVSWEQGLMLIHPKYPGAPREQEIPVLRVHVREGTKPTPPMYWDLTSKTLQAQLLPFLVERGYEAYEYVITKFGVAPKARFTLEQVPVA